MKEICHPTRRPQNERNHHLLESRGGIESPRFCPHLQYSEDEVNCHNINNPHLVRHIKFNVASTVPSIL